MALETTSGVEDELAIRALTARYNFAIAEGRAEEWADTFVEEGIFESSLLGRSTGRAALIDFARGFATQMKARPMTTDAIVEVNGDTAHQRCCLLFVDIGGGTARLSTTGVYEDDLVRTPDGWRFTHRRITPDTAL
jgi:hypothetical protein